MRAKLTLTPDLLPASTSIQLARGPGTPQELGEGPAHNAITWEQVSCFAEMQCTASFQKRNLE